MMVASLLVILTHVLCTIPVTVAFTTPSPLSGAPSRHYSYFITAPSLLAARTEQGSILQNNENGIVQPEKADVSLMDIPEIMALLEQTYPEDNEDNTKERWTKARKYLYQYRANILSKRSNNKNNIMDQVEEEELTDKQTKRKRRRRR